MSLKIISALFLTICGFNAICQNDSIIEFGNFKIPKQLEQQSKIWLNDLYNPIVITKGDTIRYTKEAVMVLTNKKYYNIIYPNDYTWEITTELMKNKWVKQSIWYMINLYMANKKINSPYILNTIISLDRVIDMEKVLINSYYSYIAFDPQVVEIENEKVKKIIRPDIAEHKLVVTEEIVAYLRDYRKSNLKN